MYRRYLGTSADEKGPVMTTTASKAGLRTAAKTRREKHAQRTELPARVPGEADGQERAEQYGAMSVDELKARAKTLGVKPLPRTKGLLLTAILAAETSVCSGMAPEKPKRPASLDCPGGEGHEEHLALNGECPWCDTVTPELQAKIDKAEKAKARRKPAETPSAPAVVAGEPTGAETKSGRKATAFAAAIEPSGWVTQFLNEGDVTEATATRGAETMYLRWVGGVFQYPATYTYLEWTVQLRNASAAKVRAAAPPEQGQADRERVAGNKSYKRRAPVESTSKVKLPFDPATATDPEVISALLGKGVQWLNNLSNGSESAIIGEDARRVFVEETDDGDRIVKFCCPSTGFRAFRLSALRRVGRGVTPTKGQATAEVTVTNSKSPATRRRKQPME